MAIVFITGASSGFGKACAQKFAASGYSIILNARRTERLLALKADLEKSYKASVYLLPFDVTNKNEVETAIKNLPDNWKRVDILINNAGLAAGRDFFQDGDIQDWEKMIDTNVKGILYVTKFLVGEMIKRKSGHIINVSSLAGQEIYPQGNVYCASKHAVTALSKGMRMDLVQHNIKVTNISPGLAETEFSFVRFHGDEEKAKQVYEGYTPLSAEDIADVIYFAATRPAHVNLEEITILPTAQSDSRTIRKE
ncbi:MAG: SDR family NAD(P)-dependent oxidoreductase [Fimbriimonadaceae bacterium]|nr:SDR family NAD(P)-dependent oxidoreductase [Chitinophagales bacterium]